MAAVKRECEVKKGPVRRRTAINFGMKLRIIRKFERGQTLSSIAREFKLATSTISTIIKDSERIKKHVKDTASLKSTIITKRREGAIVKMEELLSIWMEDEIKRSHAISLSQVQSMAKSIFEKLRKQYPNGVQTFYASNGWFARFKKRSGFCNLIALAEKNNQKIIKFVPKTVKAPPSSPPPLVPLAIEQPPVIIKEETVEEIEPIMEERIEFEPDQMEIAFKELRSCLGRFETMDSNKIRFLNVQRMVEDAFACYREIYEDKTNTSQVSSFNFIKVESTDEGQDHLMFGTTEAVDPLS